MKAVRLDHLVLTVSDLDITCDFYERVLSMDAISFSSGGVERRALRFGGQKINLHQSGAEFEPKAAHPAPGSADLCFIIDTDMAVVVSHLRNCHVKIEQGPVQRTGAEGPIVSIYFRDPDGNLNEVSRYVD